MKAFVYLAMFLGSYATANAQVSTKPVIYEVAVLPDSLFKCFKPVLVNGHSISKAYVRFTRESTTYPVLNESGYRSIISLDLEIVNPELPTGSGERDGSLRLMRYGSKRIGDVIYFSFHRELLYSYLTGEKAITRFDQEAQLTLLPNGNIRIVDDGSHTVIQPFPGRKQPSPPVTWHNDVELAPCN